MREKGGGGAAVLTSSSARSPVPSAARGPWCGWGMMRKLAFGGPPGSSKKQALPTRHWAIGVTGYCRCGGLFFFNGVNG
jgi:hypothetical protein